MRWDSRVISQAALALAAGLSAFLLGTPARADDAWRLVPIQIQAAAAVSVVLSVPGSDQATAQCVGSCTLRLFPGTYRLYAEDRRSQRTLDRSLELSGAGTVAVEFGDSSARKRGVALAVAGGVTAAVG